MSEITDQPAPVPNDRPAVWDLVIADMRDRDWTGLTRYGTRLQAFNGRDPLVDAYQEGLDLVAYLRQAIYERDERDRRIAELEALTASLSERVRKQSELLSKRAKKEEKPTGPLPPPVFAPDGTRIG